MLTMQPTEIAMQLPDPAARLLHEAELPTAE